MRVISAVVLLAVDPESAEISAVAGSARCRTLPLLLPPHGGVQVAWWDRVCRWAQEGCIACCAQLAHSCCAAVCGCSDV